MEVGRRPPSISPPISSQQVHAYRVVLQQWRQGNALCIMPGNVVDQRQQFATGTGDRGTGRDGFAAARLLLMTHAQGSIPARRKSCSSPAASSTGVVSASVTIMTLVFSGSCSCIVLALSRDL